MKLNLTKKMLITLNVLAALSLSGCGDPFAGMTDYYWMSNESYPVVENKQVTKTSNTTEKHVPEISNLNDTMSKARLNVYDVIVDVPLNINSRDVQTYEGTFSSKYLLKKTDDFTYEQMKERAVNGEDQLDWRYSVEMTVSEYSKTYKSLDDKNCGPKSLQIVRYRVPFEATLEADVNGTTERIVVSGTLVRSDAEDSTCVSQSNW